MLEFKTSIKRGMPMTRKSISTWLNILFLTLAIATVLYSPFLIASLENPLYKGLAWFGLICLLLVFVIPLGLTPYFGMREIKREKEAELNKLLPLKELKDRQSGGLLTTPRSYLDIRVKRINLFKAGYAEVEFNVTNATVHNINLSLQFGQTVVTVEGERTVLPTIPQLKYSPSSLSAGGLNSQFYITQPLTPALLDKLANSIRSKLVKWEFGLLISLVFDGQKKEDPYPLEWGGIHYEIW